MVFISGLRKIPKATAVQSVVNTNSNFRKNSNRRSCFANTAGLFINTNENRTKSNIHQMSKGANYMKKKKYFEISASRPLSIPKASAKDIKSPKINCLFPRLCSSDISRYIPISDMSEIVSG